jgi:class 3 adenylate cyclase
MDINTETAAWLQSATGVRTPVRGSCFLGRAASCQVVLPDTKVSREHALVHGQERGEFWLIDLGSANGTYLNGQRVGQPCRLSDGDQIIVAGSAFTFHRPQTPARLRSDTTLTDATIHDIRTLTCWLLVADIQGSTRLLRRMPDEEAPRITGRWLAACREILEEHRGAINKFLGDGFLGYWPARPEAAERVVGALLALKHLQERAEPPFRIALHYGQVSAGGAATMGEESLMGDEVSFVFRAEKLAAALGVSRLMSEPAHGQVKSLLATTPQGRHPLADFDGEFAFFSF